MEKMNIGKIEAVKILHIFDWGKNINTIQNGITPRFNHKKTFSIVK